MKAVEVQNLYKSYAGKPAVRDLTFAVEPGEILGLIGPNGAGKSSTVKMILDFMKPDSGEVRVFGGQMDESCKNEIGYLPEEKGLYKNLTAIELILYLASLKGMDRVTVEKEAQVLLERTGMLDSKKKKIKEMSKGMGQLIQLIVTIIHDPQLIILDEPFSGLDPVNTELVRDIVGDSRDKGTAIILSTHQMNQVEELCSDIFMINTANCPFNSTKIWPDSKFSREFNFLHKRINVFSSVNSLNGLIMQILQGITKIGNRFINDIFAYYRFAMPH